MIKKKKMITKRGLAFGLSFAFVLGGCASTIDHQSLSRSERAYLTRVQNAKTTFAVPISQSEVVWNRAQEFIARFSNMRIVTSNSYEVTTYHPNSSNGGTVGYSAVRKLDGSLAGFAVKCSHSPVNFKYTGDVCRANEKYMAHYMLTGELIDKFVNSKF